MTGLMFEIVEYDDSDGQKAEYLNAAISTWNPRILRKPILLHMIGLVNKV